MKSKELFLANVKKYIRPKLTPSRSSSCLETSSRRRA